MTTRHRSCLSIVLLALGAVGLVQAQEGQWIPLFDGKSLAGWKAAENPGSWRVVDGMLAADGPRSHLFYTGAVRKADFKNFEFRAEVMTRAGANSGIYFHTAYQEKGWPEKGFEVQINNTHVGEGEYREYKRTGSLHGIRNVYKVLFRDDEWMRVHLTVRGKQAQVRVNDLLLVDWVEPDPPVREAGATGLVIDRGTFALQGHDPHSKVLYRNLAVRPLPDDAGGEIAARPADDIDRQILALSRQNFPVVDYHIHLRGGFDLERALAESRRVGIGYGAAINCGIGFPISSDAGLQEWLKNMQGQPVFIALQGEGREWPTLVSKETRAKFDYVFTDAMTFTDHRGKRIRLWIKNEVEVTDPQAFMEMYVDRILGVLNTEPIDIYVNPTFLPDVIAADYDRLWTPERMDKVLEAARKNGIALEINNRYRIPSAAFIQRAKAAGVKLACGTNNGDARVGRLEYCLEMIKACGLTWRDMYVPRGK